MGCGGSALTCYSNSAAQRRRHTEPAISPHSHPAITIKSPRSDNELQGRMTSTGATARGRSQSTPVFNESTPKPERFENKQSSPVAQHSKPSLPAENDTRQQRPVKDALADQVREKNASLKPSSGVSLHTSVMDQTQVKSDVGQTSTVGRRSCASSNYVHVIPSMSAGERKSVPNQKDGFQRRETSQENTRDGAKLVTILIDENLQRTLVVRDDTKNAFPPFPDSIPSNTSKQQQQSLGPKGSHSQATGYSGHSFSDFSDASYSYATSTQEAYEDILYSLQPGQVYKDPEFPANNEALYLNPRQQVFGDIQWLRPQEILGDKFYPEFVIDGVTQGDIKQGILGDCWFLSSCAAVSKRKKIMSKIIPKDQALSGPLYKGVVRFFFWRFGQWVQVIIDDRLPTVKRKLIFGKCTHPREFWVPLIEKAYAKLYGCYEALGGGITMDALVDLTGGLAERFELVEHDPSLFRFIHTARRAGGFIACSRKGDWRLSNVADPNGLIPGHAYTIINTLVLEHKMGEEKMVCIRNPWGDGAKWKGSWSDHDVNWQWVDEDVRESVLGKLDSAEFWMSFRDFYHQFGEVTICHLSPDFDGDGTPDVVGHTEMLWGEWILGKTAGGSRNNLNKFATNDQYLLCLTETRMNDFESESKQNIVISLMQEHRQISRNVKPMMYQIGFFLYQTNERFYKLPLQYFRFNAEYAKTSFFINYREVSGRFELDPGSYVIIPSTFIEDCPSHFLLRVFGEKRFSLKGPLLSR